MPIGAWAHSHYWRFSNGPGVVLGGGGGNNGYVPWQTTPLLGSLFGGLQAWYERVRDVWRLYQRVKDFGPDRWAALERVCALLAAPEYDVARASVKDTALLLGFNKPEAWLSLKRDLQKRPDFTENLFRHVRAMRTLDEQQPNTLSNPEKNLLIELAYHGYAAHPQRPETWRSPSPTSV